MKSAVFYGKHDLRVEESAKPAVGRRDVLINVKACGVCGTDVHIYEGDKGAADVTPPTILGHEFAGVVEAVGSDVAGFKPGDRVCIDPNHPCGCCEPCRDGINHYCEHMTGYGTTVNGGFAEYCSVDMQQVYKLGDHTSFEQGAMTEPVACCLHGIDMCNIKPGSTVVVIGGGMIGLLMMQLAKNAGATKVVLLEPVEGKREVALKLGADLAIDSIHEDVPARLEQEGVGNVDVVIECVGKPVTIEQAIQIAGHKATVMMFGLTNPMRQSPSSPSRSSRRSLCSPRPTSTLMRSVARSSSSTLAGSTYPRWSPRWLPSTNSAPSCQTQLCVPWVNI